MQVVFSTANGPVKPMSAINIDGVSADALGAINRKALEMLQAAQDFGACAGEDKEKWDAQRKAQAALMALNKAIFMAVLAAHQVATATVNYAGDGDSGGVEETTTEPDIKSRVIPMPFCAWRSSYVCGGGVHHEISLSETNLEEALPLFTDELIAHFGHSGYENNEGGHGTVTLKPEGLVGDGVVVLEHCDYVIEGVDSNHTL